MITSVHTASVPFAGCVLFTASVPFGCTALENGSAVACSDYALKETFITRSTWVSYAVSAGYLAMEMAIPGPFLVVVPLSTVPNWIREFRKWLPQVNALVYVGDSKSREVCTGGCFWVASQYACRQRITEVQCQFPPRASAIEAHFQELDVKCSADVLRLQIHVRLRAHVDSTKHRAVWYIIFFLLLMKSLQLSPQQARVQRRAGDPEL